MIVLIIILYIILFIYHNINIKKETFINNNSIYNIIKKQKINKTKYNKNKIYNEYKNCKNCSLVLYQIKNNNLDIKDKNNINPRIHNKRIDYITSLIKETLKKYKIGDMIFIVSLRDNLPNLKISYLGPVYEENKNSLAIPSNWWAYFTKSDNRLFIPSLFDQIINEYKNKNTNQKKDNRIVFRGTNNCELRRKVRKLSKLTPKLVDVELPIGKSDKNYIPNDNLISNYQYYFVLRGRGKWTGSINQFSLANGTLFKIEENSKQPIELLLEPDIDYVSINNNLSNFREKVNLVANKNLMNQMKNNLEKKSNIFFTSDNIMKYMYYCLINLYD